MIQIQITNHKKNTLLALVGHTRGLSEIILKIQAPKIQEKCFYIYRRRRPNTLSVESPTRSKFGFQMSAHE